MKLWVSEIFHSLQGEGPYIGQPATFIRTAYCNLHCKWCDAWYTWDHRRVDVKATSEHVEVDDVINRLGKNTLVIITGGEPLLQADAIAELVGRMSNAFIIQFETNGTVIPAFGIERRSPTYVVSPKLRNSGDSLQRRIRPEVIKWFIFHDSFFKFVISHPRDVEEVGRLCKEFEIPAHKVWLMPEGTTSFSTGVKMGWLAQACLEHGYNLTDRLHIRCFGDRRGT